jgi:hypothetical protein
MLGRRLFLLAAVLLAVGAIAAALTPRDMRKSGPTASGTTSAPPEPNQHAAAGAEAREISRTVDASAAKPAIVRTRTGDLLHLVVRAPAPDEVELQGLGRFESVDESSPARFDFFLVLPGTFPIRLQQSGRVLGRLVVDAKPL